MARPRGATAKRIFHAGKLYAIKDLAALRGVTPQTVYRMLESGRSVAHIISGAKATPGGQWTRSNPGALFHGCEDELGEIAERRALLTVAQRGTRRPSGRWSRGTGCDGGSIAATWWWGRGVEHGTHPDRRGQ